MVAATVGDSSGTLTERCIYTEMDYYLKFFNRAEDIRKKRSILYSLYCTCEQLIQDIERELCC